MSALGLGTVQFGMPYGVANRGARTPHDELVAIIGLAAASGIRVLDTAALYGDSERALGAALPSGHRFLIVTKTPVFGGASRAAAAPDGLAAAFETSLANLGQDKLYALLVHDAGDLLKPGGDALWKAMDELRRQGLIEKAGVSVYTAAEIDSILPRFEPGLVQLPVSIVDQRLVQSGHLSALKRRGVEIHARSVLLQGLLLMRPEERPAYFSRFDSEISGFNRFLSRYGMTPLEAALAFVSDLDEIDVALVGVTSRAQLEACLDAFHPPRESRPDFSAAACRSESLLNPALWPTSR